jgi:hypothetical protein
LSNCAATAGGAAMELSIRGRLLIGPETTFLLTSIISFMKDKMNAVRVVSEEEFERLLDHMTHHAHRAADHWQLLKGMEGATNKYAVEMHESRAFWSFTLYAHYDDVLFRLARLYDQEKSSLSLKRFLLTIKSNVEYFSQKAIAHRLRDNPYVEGLSSRKLNLSTLGNDIRRVSAERDPIVSHLWNLRNRHVSHVDPNPVRLGTLPTLRGLKPQEIETLLKRACKILARYSLIYRASWVSSEVVGADDYIHLLDLVRRGRASVIAEHEEKIRRWKNAREP